jgi:hypothetical protein
LFRSAEPVALRVSLYFDFAKELVMENMADITARRSPEPPHPLQEFLRIPWANVLYLGSAMSILTGVSMVIRPIYDQQDLALERFGVLGALNGYEIAILAVTLALIIWRNIKRDAVALVVLMSAFLIGSAATLDTVAPGYAMAAVYLGVGGLLLAIGKGWLVSTYAIGRFTRTQWAGISLVVAWNFLAPGILGNILGSGGLADDLRPVWLGGSWVIVLSMGLLILDTTRTHEHDADPRTHPGPAPDSNAPFLTSPLMRWIVLGIIFACTLLHQWALAWSFNFDIQTGDLWLSVALLGVLACEVHRRTGSRFWKLDLFILSLVFLFALSILQSKEYSATISQPLSLTGHLPLAMIAVGLLVESLAWLRQRRHWLHLPALAYVGVGLASLGSDLELTINRGWLLIGASFILLAIGAAVSMATHQPVAARETVER